MAYPRASVLIRTCQSYIPGNRVRRAFGSLGKFSQVPVRSPARAHSATYQAEFRRRFTQDKDVIDESPLGTKRTRSLWFDAAGAGGLRHGDGRLKPAPPKTAAG